MNLNEFVTWINDYCADHGRLDRIPTVNRTPWRLMTSQFRRTLAWFIARQPGGTIAGALQYRHHSIQMFEGYVGTSDSGFRAEVESEQALDRGVHLLTMVDTHQHHDLDGPAADEAARRLDSLNQRVEFPGMVVLDRARLKRIMRKHDPAIYPGRFVTCVHDHTKAVCTKARTGGSEGLPDHGSCRPLHCANVALTAENRGEWETQLTDIQARLNAPLPPPPLLERVLRQRHTEITNFLDRTTKDTR